MSQGVDYTSTLEDPWSAKILGSFLTYDPVKGTVLQQNNRPLIADQDGLVIVTNPETKAKKKFKLNKLCYSLFTGIDLDKDTKVLHKNLNRTDYSALNLVLVSSLEFRQIKEAWRNIQGGIRLVPHPTDMYCYRIHWYEGAVEKKQLVRDIVVAKRLQKKLLLRYSKFLTKYCCEDIKPEEIQEQNQLG